MKLRRSSAFLLSLALIGALSGGCKQGAGPDPATEARRLAAELAAAQQKLGDADKRQAAQQEQFAAHAAAADAAQKQVAEKQVDLLEKDGQIRALQKEVAELRKSEAQAFAEASATLQKGVTSITLSRYQQFVRDFPKSPLVLDANRAIAELTVTADREAQWRKSLIDPKRPEREALQHFADGIASVEEILPLIKRRTMAEVKTLLGPPSTTYRNGSELGYAGRVIDPKTGERGTLVIGFEEERVSGVRVGYQGREIKP